MVILVIMCSNSCSVWLNGFIFSYLDALLTVKTRYRRNISPMIINGLHMSMSECSVLFKINISDHFSTKLAI